ncbi:MAG: hypothetical protein HYZ67_02665 [Chlamydiae bacterium]|nr:hypothetical protein [Chlamydiota bacterium]
MRLELLSTVKSLDPKEFSEILDFARYLKMKHIIDPEQAYFWTKEWQRKEKEIDEAKKKGEILGDGTVKGLFKSIKKAS